MVTSQALQLHLAVLSNQNGSEFATKLSLDLANKFAVLNKNTTLSTELAGLANSWQASCVSAYDFYNENENDSVSLALRCLDRDQKPFNRAPNVPLILVIDTENSYEYVQTIVRLFTYQWSFFLQQKPCNVFIFNMKKKADSHQMLSMLSTHDFALQPAMIQFYFGNMNQDIQNYPTILDCILNPNKNSFHVFNNSQLRRKCHLFHKGINLDKPDGFALEIIKTEDLSCVERDEYIGNSDL